MRRAGMKDFRDLMVELAGEDPETVKRKAREYGSLPVRLAMLGLAAIKKGSSPLWYGYPPGVFISYKWADGPLQQYVIDLATHLRELGLRVFLDRENLDRAADDYFSVPEFIVSLQECNYYVLLLTELCADLITARKRKTSWIFDEYQHAARLVNSGRLVVIPVLLEPNGVTEFFTRKHVVDLTANWHDFRKVDQIFPVDPISLTELEVDELSRAMEEFDSLFLQEHWSQAREVLLHTAHLETAFDHQFRCMLHAIYTANEEALEPVLRRLNANYGEQFVFHVYSGYCELHGIPNQASWEPSS